MDDKELKYVLKEYVMNKIEAYFVGHNFEKRDYSEDKIIYVIDEMLVILLKIEVKSDYCLSFKSYELTYNYIFKFNLSKFRDEAEYDLKKYKDEKSNNGLFIYGLLEYIRYIPNDELISEIRKDVSVNTDLDFEKIDNLLLSIPCYRLIVSMDDKEYKMIYFDSISEKRKKISLLVSRLKSAPFSYGEHIFKYYVEEARKKDTFDGVSDYYLIENIKCGLIKYDFIPINTPNSKKSNESDINIGNPFHTVEQDSLTKRIKTLFKDDIVLTEYNPQFKMKNRTYNFRYDIFLKYRRVAVEYQGIQHYKPVEFFGGKKGFEKTKERDKNKKLVSDINNVSIVYVNYDEKYSDNDLKKMVEQSRNERLKKVGIYLHKVDFPSFDFLNSFYLSPKGLKDFIFEKYNEENTFSTNEFIFIGDYDGDADYKCYKTQTPLIFNDLIAIYYGKFFSEYPDWDIKKYSEILYYCIKYVYDCYDHCFENVLLDSSTGEKNAYKTQLYGDDYEIFNMIVEEGNTLFDIKIKELQAYRRRLTKTIDFSEYPNISIFSEFYDTKLKFYNVARVYDYSDCNIKTRNYFGLRKNRWGYEEETYLVEYFQPISSYAILTCCYHMGLLEKQKNIVKEVGFYWKIVEYLMKEKNIQIYLLLVGNPNYPITNHYFIENDLKMMKQVLDEAFKLYDQYLLPVRFYRKKQRNRT